MLALNLVEEKRELYSSPNENNPTSELRLAIVCRVGKQTKASYCKSHCAHFFAGIESNFNPCIPRSYAASFALHAVRAKHSSVCFSKASTSIRWQVFRI